MFKSWIDLNEHQFTIPVKRRAMSRAEKMNDDFSQLQKKNPGTQMSNLTRVNRGSFLGVEWP